MPAANSLKVVLNEFDGNIDYYHIGVINAVAVSHTISDFTTWLQKCIQHEDLPSKVHLLASSQRARCFPAACMEHDSPAFDTCGCSLTIMPACIDWPEHPQIQPPDHVPQV